MIGRVSARNAGPPAPRLARIRSRWLSAATASLRADDWSDIDLLIVVDDSCLTSSQDTG